MDCIAFNCGGFGISCSGGENITFRGCESYGNVWHGFHVGLGKTTGYARCAIENCYAHHNDWVGIYIGWNVTESVFLGNHLSEVEVPFRISFPDTESGAAAAALVPRLVSLSHEKLCTVSRTVMLPTPVRTVIADEGQE